MGSTMSALRQRRGATRVHPEPAAGALKEPLLAGDALESAAGDAASTEPLLGEPRPRRSAAEQHELPWPLAAVWHALTAAWHWIVDLLLQLLPQRFCAAPQLSLLQQERLSSLRERAAVAYDEEATEHVVRVHYVPLRGSQ